MGCDHARHYVPLMADGRGTDDDFRMRDGSRRMKARTNISVTITWNEYGCGAVRWVTLSNGYDHKSDRTTKLIMYVSFIQTDFPLFLWR